MNKAHATASTRIREHILKDRTERLNPDHKLRTAKIVPAFNPPIAKSLPIPPDPQLRQKIRHGSPRKGR